MICVEFRNERSQNNKANIRNYCPYVVINMLMNNTIYLSKLCTFLGKWRLKLLLQFWNPFRQVVEEVWRVIEKAALDVPLSQGWRSL